MSLLCKGILATTVASLIAYDAWLMGDTAYSKSGETLKGKIVSETEDSVVFDSLLVGEVILKRENLSRIIKDESEDAPNSFANRLEKLNTPLENEGDETFDWIQLTSGEWLKGTINAMYSNSLEFDSDELDEQEFDWEDISRIRSAKNYSVRVDQNTTRVGRLALKDRELSISDDANAEIGQFDLISIAPDQAFELDSWTSKISLTSSYRSGSSEQRDIGLSGHIQKRTSFRRLYADFLSNYSVSNNETTSDDLRINAYFDSFRTQRIFIRPASLEYFRDPLQNIKRRSTLSASLGYHIVDNRKTTWDVTFGPAVQRAEYLNVSEGESRIEEDPALLLTSQFDTELTKKLDLKGSYKIQFADTKGGLTFHSWTKLEYELTERIDLDFTFLWDRIEAPVRTASGVIPGNDDIRTTIGIGLEL